MSETPKHSAEQGYNWSQTESGLYVPESKWGEKPASEQIATNPETIDDRPSPSVEMRATIDDLSAQLDELNSDNRLLGSGEAREKREKIAHLEEDLGNLNTLWTQLGGESVDSTLSIFRQRETEVKNYREANPGEKVPEAIDRMVSDASDAYRAQKTRFDQEYRTWEAAQKQISS